MQRMKAIYKDDSGNNIVLPSIPEKTLTTQTVTDFRMTKEPSNSGNLRFIVAPWTGVSHDKAAIELSKTVQVDLSGVATLPEVIIMLTAIENAAVAIMNAESARQ